MSVQRILIVEDERNLADTLSERLAKEGFQVEVAPSCEQAQLHLDSGGRFDLALLDVGLPDGDGFTVAKHIRKKHPSTAIIFLTAFAGPDERVKGLELGAEDYVAKPFHLKELILRVRNALKRGQALQAAPQEVRIGRAMVRFDRFEAEVGGVTQGLSQKECALLRLLVEKGGQVVSRDAILNEVWAPDEYPTPRTIDNFILRLRRLVEENPESPAVIRSVRGVGYQLNTPGAST